MKTSANPPIVDDDWIDRIVDGACDPGELRAAVVVLDQTEDGWKRLAIGFLEAQAITQALGPRERSAVVRPRGFWPRLVGIMAASAASFAMGWMGHAVSPAPAGASVQIASQPVVRSAQEPVIESGLQRRPVVFDEGSGPSSEPPAVVRGTQMDSVERYLASQPSALSEHARYQLEREGYRVREERRLITGVLPDGTRVITPVEHYQIQYAGNGPL